MVVGRAFPMHGTRARVRNLNCGCVACTGRTGAVDPGTYVLRWPLRPLKSRLTADVLAMWVDEPTLRVWASEGLTDAEADEISVRVGLLPHVVWNGYLEAGLDYRDVKGEVEL